MEKVKAIVNGKVYRISSSPIENCTIILSGGKIQSVGQDIQIPKEAEVIDAKGKVVLPGFVDAHTHVGLWGEWYGPAEHDGNEGSNPVTPEVRAIDAIWPEHTAFLDARSGGITSVQVNPGSGNVIGGETCAIKTYGEVIDDMVMKAPSGHKVALGENPKGYYGRTLGKAPKTRMGIASILRATLYKAKDYMKKMEWGEKDPSKKPDTDLGLLNLIKVLKGEIPLRIHAHRADDIVTAVRIAEEFGLDYSIEHCTDGATVAEFLGQRHAKVNVGPSMWHRAKIETLNISPATPGILAKAGCKVSIISDHPFHPIQFLSVAAAVAWANGMTEKDALRAVTLTPAETIGIDDRVGSIDPGKDGDIVIWSGHPFRIRSKPERVFISGEEVFSAL